MSKQHLGLISAYKFKGTLEKKMNHPFRGIDKFSCNKTELEVNDTAIDIEDFEAKVILRDKTTKKISYVKINKI